jgi:hypothetical protein
MVPPHLEVRFAALDGLPPGTIPPDPWKKVATFAVGGLASVGFDESSDLLLVTSSAGRGVFDCVHGVRLARDSGDFDFDIGNLTVAGIGPVAGKLIRVAGLDGGGLSWGTTDGWGIERHPASWPEDVFFLSPPGHSMLWSPAGQPLRLTKLAGFISEVRAFGFSPTGRTLVVATASDIWVFGR